MMSVARNAHILVEVKSKTLCKRCRRVCLAFILERFWAWTKISIKYFLHSYAPLRRQFLCFVLSHSRNVWFEQAEELAEVGKRVASKRTRSSHCRFRAKTVAACYLQRVANRTALREAAVAMHPHVIDGTVHIVFVSYKHFAKVVCLARLSQNLTLKECHRSVCPARSASVLVLYRGYGILFYGYKSQFVVVIVLRTCRQHSGRQE